MADLIGTARQEGICSLTGLVSDRGDIDDNMVELTRLLGCPSPPTPLIQQDEIWKFHMNWFIEQLPPGVSLNRSPTAYRLNAVVFLPLPADAFHQPGPMMTV